MAGYKLATYQTSEGPRAGLVIDDKVYDAAKLTGKPAYASVLGIIADWRAARGAPQEGGRGGGKEPGEAAAARRAPSCWRRCAGRRRSIAPAPTMPIMPRRWPAA